MLVGRSACAAELEADRDSQLTPPCASHVACATTHTDIVSLDSPLQRCKHFEIGGDKKVKGMYG